MKKSIIEVNFVLKKKMMQKNFVDISNNQLNREINKETILFGMSEDKLNGRICVGGMMSTKLRMTFHG